MRSYRLILIAGLAATVSSGPAAATRLPIPGHQPVVTVDIPQSWNPTITERGLEGAALDGSVRLAVELVLVADPELAVSVATGRLSGRGILVTPNTKRMAPRRFNGFDAFKVDFDGADSLGDCDISIILIAIPQKSEFVSMAYWGDGDAQESVSNDILSIADSVEISK